ncbi:MAG: DNA alkylation repair protein [Chitinophagaceae bacterium]|nr:DNA alkylation repair protein [Chitinophagaceae bacterium]MCW5915218.1 DNA alkylation repair protein [Chitinophagaceae bacterium]MCZ2396445.1 DNA alkylation repair protein [Chitinophagales bacterium]
MPQLSYRQLQTDLRSLANPKKAKNSAWFFKTGKGQYGEGDVFVGVTMPEQRKVAKRYLHLPLEEVTLLLQAPEHEFRMCALLILVAQYKKGTEREREKIYSLYLQSTRWINNWDLVDTSAEYIVGDWLQGRKEKMKTLKALANSESLWERRIAMLATFCYIKKGSTEEALDIAKILLKDEHDLIHKAAGWMLREIGKRCSIQEEEAFLKAHYKHMPRTMLRYAIEHFPETKRKAYLNGKV